MLTITSLLRDLASGENIEVPSSFSSNTVELLLPSSFTTNTVELLLSVFLCVCIHIGRTL